MRRDYTIPAAEPVEARVSRELRDQIDASRRAEGLPNQAAAIRRLLEDSLEAKGFSRRPQPSPSSQS